MPLPVIQEIQSKYKIYDQIHNLIQQFQFKRPVLTSGSIFFPSIPRFFCRGMMWNCIIISLKISRFESIKCTTVREELGPIFIPSDQWDDDTMWESLIWEKCVFIVSYIFSCEFSYSRFYSSQHHLINLIIISYAESCAADEISYEISYFCSYSKKLRMMSDLIWESTMRKIICGHTCF